jgi:hypothetical protein
LVAKERTPRREEWFLDGLNSSGEARDRSDAGVPGDTRGPLRVTFPNTHMEGVASTAQRRAPRLLRVIESAGGSASAVVDVCVATHMRGLVPHDWMCEMRSGAVLWRRA